MLPNINPRLTSGFATYPSASPSNTVCAAARRARRSSSPALLDAGLPVAISAGIVPNLMRMRMRLGARDAGAPTSGRAER